MTVSLSSFDPASVKTPLFCHNLFQNCTYEAILFLHETKSSQFLIDHFECEKAKESKWQKRRQSQTHKYFKITASN